MQGNAESLSNPVEIFMKSWRLYQDIIEHNYMFHQEITQAVSDELSRFKAGSTLRILDMGCGDASMALPLVLPTRITRYIGCDLSQPALNIAHRQLSSNHISHQLICDDMLHVAAEQPEDSFDLIISSYAIHHLNATQKEKIVQDIARMLTPDGCFVLIDIFREPTEDRAAYIRNYMGRLRESWTKLATESQAIVIDHATNYDFPEHPYFYTSICQKHGLSSGKQLVKHTWHQAWLFTNTTTD